MGLDIYFNKARALAAGLVITEDTNGTAEDIARSVALGDQENPEYLQWLREKSHITNVPGTNYFVTVWAGGEELSIRANKWGTTYGPLTAWLSKHGIDWSEA